MGVLAIVAGIRHAPPRRARGMVAVRGRPVPLLRRRPLHVQLPEAVRGGRRVPVARRRALPRRLPGCSWRAVPAHPAAQPAPDRAALIDALILTIGVGLLSWVFLIAPNIHLAGLHWLAKTVSVAYPLGDVLLLAGGIRLAVDAGKRTPAFYLLVGSIVCLLTTDSAYNLRAARRAPTTTSSIYDAGWIVYYLLWGAAALHPSMRTLEEPAATRARG